MGISARPSQVMETGARILPPAGALGWLPPMFWGQIRNYYAYVTEFLPLTASATATNVITIQSDSYFVIMYATITETTSNNLTLLPFNPLLVNLTDSSSGAAFFSLPIHSNNVFGDAQNAGIFAIPYIMRPGSSISVQLTNLEAVDRNVRIAFHGFKSVPSSDMRTGQMYGAGN